MSYLSISQMRTPQKTMIFDGYKKVRIHCSTVLGPVFLNPELIIKQDRTWLQVQGILDIHKKKARVLRSMQNTDDPEHLRKLAKIVTDFEYKLQALWGFHKNKRFHKFWELPKCRCPKADNNDLYPAPLYFLSSSCPIHGWEDA